MLQERIEPAWIDAFDAVLRRCALQQGDTVAILGESQSRPVLVELARLAAARLGARVETGTVFANRCDYLDPALVWTGVKDTGRGTSLSYLGFHSVTRPKSYHLKKAPK